MSLKRYATKRDATEPAIIDALEAVGARVIRLDTFDLLVLYRGKLHMLDAKSKGGKRTKMQQFLVELGWPLQFVETPDAALQIVGAVKC